MMDDDKQRLNVEGESFSEHWKRVFEGLNAPKDSGDYKYAKLAMQRFFGPSTISMVVTVVVIALLAVAFAAKMIPPEPVIETKMVDAETEEIEELIEEEPEPEPEPEEIENLEPSHELQNAETTAIVNEAPSFGDESTDDIVPMAVDIISSPMVIKGLYGSRLGGGKATAAGRHGGGGSALTAVIRALRWLKANQNYDGSWPGRKQLGAGTQGEKVGMTGLALLCYLAHGETTSSEEFGPTVEKAIKYLLSVQQGDGRFPAAECGDHFVYGHALGTYALAEAYGMMRNVQLKDPVERACNVIIQGQQAGGAWDYDYQTDMNKRRDLSVTAWQIQALKAAKLAGAEPAGLEGALQKSVGGIKSFIVDGGLMTYNPSEHSWRGSSPTLTAAGVLCLQLLGRGDDPAARSALAAIRSLPCTWEAKDVNKDNTYSWYYGAQAKFQAGGPSWKNWNDRMLPMLTKNQMKDGHWEHGATWGTSPVYDTTLCCLCLEVYYRYLPTYLKVDEQKPEVTTEEEDDVEVRIDLVL